MRNKKIGLLVLSGLAAVCCLSACSETVARPIDSDYYAKILDLDGVTNNSMSRIYDAIVKAGDTNSEKVLNNILRIYATTLFGDFYPETENGTSLRTVVLAYMANPADEKAKEAIKAYAKHYDFYHNADGTGNINKVIAFYKDVVLRVETSFLGYVRDTQYQVRNTFYEQKFYDAQKKNYYTLGTVADDNSDLNQKLVEGSLRLTDGTLGIADSLVGADGYFNDIFDRYGEYIENALLPDIYRNYLVSQYLYEENYRALGLNYARKVDIVSLEDNTNKEYVTATQNLAQYYAEEVIEKGLSMEDYGFEFLVSMFKGTIDLGKAGSRTPVQEKAIRIYELAGWTEATFNDPLNGGAATTYYEQSQIGSYYRSYNKLKDNRLNDDSTIRSEFTGNGAYAPEVGLLIKKNTLISDNSRSTNGWYSSTSFSDSALPSETKSRLFKVNVANEVDFNLAAEGSDHTYEYEGKAAEYKYGWYRGTNNVNASSAFGSYYLTKANYDPTNETPYVIYDSGKTYICKVDEAVNTSKLKQDGTATAKAYSNMAKHQDDPLYTEYIARQVAYNLSSSDTYKKSSNKYFVEKMAITFHDDAVYKYFKTTFADLFN